MQEGRLYMLQTRNAKRPAQAAVRFAVDAVAEGLLDRREAIATIDPAALDALLHPTFDPSVALRGAGYGGGRLARAPPRARSSSAPPEAVAGRGRGSRGDPRALVHRGRRRRRLSRRPRHPHERGGQGQPRRTRRSRHGPPGGDWCERDRGRPRRRRGARRRARIAPRGRSDRDRRQPRDGSRSRTCRWSSREVSEQFQTVLAWCDELRTLGVRANADTPADALKAIELGAEGIGLCRTEHMFLGDRQPLMAAVIMAEERLSARARRSSSCARCRSRTSSRSSRAVEGRPVTVRLLDPPLHEFLPHPSDLPEGSRGAPARGAAAGVQPDARHARRAAGHPLPGAV